MGGGGVSQGHVGCSYATGFCNMFYHQAFLFNTDIVRKVKRLFWKKVTVYLSGTCLSCHVFSFE